VQNTEGPSLKKKAFNSVAWSAIDRFSSTGVQFILNIFIARLLLPSDYGLIGMLAVFIALAQSLVASGFNIALIQKKDVDEKDLSTVFYFNIAVSIVIYTVLFFSSGYIAEFYDTPLLAVLAKVIGLNILINSTVLVQKTILARNLNFKKQTIINLISTVISGGLGITAAFMGYGVWALVIQTISRNTLITLLFWGLSKWGPSLIFSYSSLKNLFKFGSRILASGILNVIFDNLYIIIIGKFYSAKELGFYTRAFQFNQFPPLSISSIILQVFLPVFSKIQDEKTRIIGAYKKTIKLIAFAVFPLMLGMGAVAKPLILLLLTEKWLPVVPLLQILVFIGMTIPIHALNMNLLNVNGRSDLFLRLEIIKKALIIIAVVVTVPYGVMVMVVGQLVASIIGFFINTYYTQKLYHYGPFSQIYDFGKYFILSIIMALLTYILTLQIQNLFLSLIIPMIFAILFYLSVSYFIKSEELNETVKILSRGKFNLFK
jgi:teichuronic acid exporter